MNTQLWMYRLLELEYAFSLYAQALQDLKERSMFCWLAAQIHDIF